MNTTVESAALQRMSTVSHSGVWAELGDIARRIGSVAVHWVRNSMERTELAHLDDRTLRDIGLNRATAIGESNKWFWQQ